MLGFDGLAVSGLSIENLASNPSAESGVTNPWIVADPAAAPDGELDTAPAGIGG